MQLAGAVALVTGGASGLGLATATELARAGAAVVIADRCDDDREQVRAVAGGFAHMRS